MTWGMIVLLTNAKLKETSVEVHIHLLQSLRCRMNYICSGIILLKLKYNTLSNKSFLIIEFSHNLRETFYLNMSRSMA